MKIYFAASIRSGREHAHIYDQLISHLKRHGTVLTEHVGDQTLDWKGSVGTVHEIHDQDFSWLSDADVIIADVTTPSLGVGYELGRAVEQGKRILCLYKPQEKKALSAMIAGCPGVIVKEYNTVEEAKKIIDTFLA